MNIHIGDRTYTVVSEECRAAKELGNMTPLQITMQELCGKEVYGDLPKSLTQDAHIHGEVHAGDILLWGDDTIVLSCMDFDSCYSFTKIGRIVEPDGLEDILRSGNVEVVFT